MCECIKSKFVVITIAGERQYTEMIGYSGKCLKKKKRERDLNVELSRSDARSPSKLENDNC